MRSKWIANIIGDEWDRCYLHETPERKRQILKDLQIEVDQKGPSLVSGYIIDIDVKDHSMAVELFEVISVFKRSKIVKVEYAGGAS